MYDNDADETEHADDTIPDHDRVFEKIDSQRDLGKWAEQSDDPWVNSEHGRNVTVFQAGQDDMEDIVHADDYSSPHEVASADDFDEDNDLDDDYRIDSSTVDPPEMISERQHDDPDHDAGTGNIEYDDQEEHIFASPQKLTNDSDSEMDGSEQQELIDDSDGNGDEKNDDNDHHGNHDDNNDDNTSERDHFANRNVEIHHHPVVSPLRNPEDSDHEECSLDSDEESSSSSSSSSCSSDNDEDDNPFPPSEIITSEHDSEWWDAHGGTEHAVRVTSPHEDGSEASDDNLNTFHESMQSDQDFDIVGGLDKGPHAHGREDHDSIESYEHDGHDHHRDEDSSHDQYSLDDGSHTDRDLHHDRDHDEDSYHDEFYDDTYISIKKEDPPEQRPAHEVLKDDYSDDGDHSDDDDHDEADALHDSHRALIEQYHQMSSQEQIEMTDHLAQLLLKSPSTSEGHSMSLSTDNEFTEHSATFRSLFRSERSRGSMYLSPETESGSSRHNKLHERIQADLFGGDLPANIDLRDAIIHNMPYPPPPMTAIAEQSSEPNTPVQQKEGQLQQEPHEDRFEEMRRRMHQQQHQQQKAKDPEEQIVDDRGLVQNEKSKHISEILLDDMEEVVDGSAHDNESDKESDDDDDSDLEDDREDETENSEGDSEAESETEDEIEIEEHPDGEPMIQPSPSRITRTEQRKGTAKVLYIVDQFIQLAEEEYEADRATAREQHDAKMMAMTKKEVVQCPEFLKEKWKRANIKESQDPAGTKKLDSYGGASDNAKSNGQAAATASLEKYGIIEDVPEQPEVESIEAEIRFTEAMNDYLEKISKEPVGVVKTPTKAEKKKKKIRSNFGTLRQYDNSDESSKSSSSDDDDVIPPRISTSPKKVSNPAQYKIDLDEEEFTEAVQSYLSLGYKHSDTEASDGDNDDNEEDQTTSSKARSKGSSKKPKKAKKIRMRPSSVPPSKKKNGKRDDASDHDDDDDEVVRKPRSFSHRSSRKKKSNDDEAVRKPKSFSHRSKKKKSSEEDEVRKPRSFSKKKDGTDKRRRKKRASSRGKSSRRSKDTQRHRSSSKSKKRSGSKSRRQSSSQVERRHSFSGHPSRRMDDYLSDDNKNDNGANDDKKAATKLTATELLDIQVPPPIQTIRQQFEMQRPASFRLSSRPELPLDFLSALPSLQS